MGFSPGLVRHGYIAQWLERLTADQQGSGSNPGVPFYFARYLWNVAFPLSVASSSWRLTFSCALAWLWPFFVIVWASPGGCVPIALMSCANSQLGGGSSGPRKAPEPLLALRSCSFALFQSQLVILCSHWRPEIQIYCHKRGGARNKQTTKPIGWRLKRAQKRFKATFRAPILLFRPLSVAIGHPLFPLAT